MKKILIILAISFNLSAAEVGWVKGGVFSAPAVVGNGIQNILVTTDDFQVDPNGFAVINLDSDAPSGNTRSVIVLPGQIVGQKIRFACRPVGGNSEIEDNTAIPGGGFIRTATSWACNQDGNSLTLFWNGTDWEEDGRVNL